MTSTSRSFAPESTATTLEALGGQKRGHRAERIDNHLPLEGRAVTDVHSHTLTEVAMQVLVLDVSLILLVFPE